MTVGKFLNNAFDESPVDAIFSFWSIGKVKSAAWVRECSGGGDDRTGRSDLIFSVFEDGIQEEKGRELLFEIDESLKLLCEKICLVHHYSIHFN